MKLSYSQVFRNFDLTEMFGKVSVHLSYGVLVFEGQIKSSRIKEVEKRDQIMNWTAWRPPPWRGAAHAALASTDPVLSRILGLYLQKESRKKNTRNAVKIASKIASSRPE